MVTHILHFLPRRHVKRIFMDFLSKRFGEKYKHIELALNFVQKQEFSLKITFSLHFSWIPIPWSSKKLFLKFSFFAVTPRPERKEK